MKKKSIIFLSVITVYLIAQIMVQPIFEDWMSSAVGSNEYIGTTGQVFFIMEALVNAIAILYFVAYAWIIKKVFEKDVRKKWTQLVKSDLIIVTLLLGYFFYWWSKSNGIEKTAAMSGSNLLGSIYLFFPFLLYRYWYSALSDYKPLGQNKAVENED